MWIKCPGYSGHNRVQGLHGHVELASSPSLATAPLGFCSEGNKWEGLRSSFGHQEDNVWISSENDQSERNELLDWVRKYVFLIHTHTHTQRKKKTISCFYAQTHKQTLASINLGNKQKQTDTHSRTHTHRPPHPFIECPFSRWLPVGNNKHTDCLEAIKRALWALSSQLTVLCHWKGVGVARCIVCYRRVLFKESKSLNIWTKVPQGLADWGLPSLALILNRGLGEGGNVWARAAGQVWRLMDMATWAIDGPRGSCWPNSRVPCDPGHRPAAPRPARPSPTSVIVQDREELAGQTLCLLCPWIPQSLWPSSSPSQLLTSTYLPVATL